MSAGQNENDSPEPGVDSFDSPPKDAGHKRDRGCPSSRRRASSAPLSPLPPPVDRGRAGSVGPVSPKRAEMSYQGPAFLVTERTRNEEAKRKSDSSREHRSRPASPSNAVSPLALLGTRRARGTTETGSCGPGARLAGDGRPRPDCSFHLVSQQKEPIEVLRGEGPRGENSPRALSSRPSAGSGPRAESPRHRGCVEKAQPRVGGKAEIRPVAVGAGALRCRGTGPPSGRGPPRPPFPGGGRTTTLLASNIQRPPRR